MTPPPELPPNLSGDWQLDAEPVDESLEPVAPAEDESLPAPISSPQQTSVSPPAETPPSPEQLVEAMLFAGGHPLTADAACAAIRGLSLEQFHAVIDALGRRYRRQGRPCAIQPRDGGYLLTLVPAFRGLREKLYGGPKEAHLGQAAIDVLSVVAYRQPVAKSEVDAIRGMDSGGVLRQLVRLGLIAVQHRADAESRAVRYGTTARFLQVFGLASLEELPRLGDTGP